jgi:hypothetical protein
MRSSSRGAVFVCSLGLRRRYNSKLSTGGPVFLVFCRSPATNLRGRRANLRRPKCIPQRRMAPASYRAGSGAYAAEIFSYKFSLNQGAADALLKRSICRRAQETAQRATRAGCDRVRRRFPTEYRHDKMTLDVFEKFLSDSKTYFGLQQPMPVSSVFPFSKLTSPEGSRSLPSGSLPPFSPDSALAKPANPEAPS